MSSVKRNRALDFWRFVFSLMIVLCHAGTLKTQDQWVFKGNFWFASYQVAVEFFFIVSGLLMARNVEKWDTKETKIGIPADTGIQTLRFVIGKVKGFYLEYLMAFILSIVVSNLIQGTFSISFVQSFFELFMLHIVGMSSNEIAVGASWYLSAMVFAMFLLFPLLYIFRKTFLYWIAPLLSLFFIGWLYKEEAILVIALQWNGFICVGLVRAVADICFGCTAYVLAKYLMSFNFTPLAQALLTAVEFTGYLGTLLLAAFYSGKTDFICLFFIWVAVSVTFSGQTYSAKMFSNPFFTKMGQFSLHLYLNHMIWMRLLNMMNMSLTFPQEFAICLVLSCVSAAATMNTVMLIRTVYKEYSHGLKSMLIRMN